MPMFPRIHLENVSVDFPVFNASAKSLRHVLFLEKVQKVKRSFIKGKVGGTISENDKGQAIVRALSDVNLDIRPGDRIGLVGHNGSGKTTLLRILSGIFEPTGGTVHIFGETMPLFNITEGMEPDATGMELIRVRGYFLGLSSAEIEHVAEDVIDFCELGDFINLPVRTYSSGMFIRLAFGIATALTADILLMDEVIGAGDAAFMERADARLKKFVNRAGILVVASHSPEIIQNWCTKAVLLEHGRVALCGDTGTVLSTYHSRVADYAA